MVWLHSLPTFEYRVHVRYRKHPEIKLVHGIQVTDHADEGPDMAAELIAYCRDHLSSIKCPKSIDFIEALPRHATGKLYKRLLKDQYCS
jgi:acyl-coenzyme A synthetase/AMP-(fatty) acid ligase